METNDKEYTYVFETKEDMSTKLVPSKFRRKIWQIFPSVCATLMCLPFGMMLGWPSPTYPTLLKPQSPLPINLDQSAMVAGFLMIGNTATTPFSSTRRFAAKHGVIIGAVLMTIGWIIMWQASDIYWLLGSRFLTGAGNGYGTGQLRLYIGEICQEPLALILTKQINLYVFFGVIVAFACGPFVAFRQFSLIGAIVAIFVLFLAVFLPSTPRQLLLDGKPAQAKKLVEFLSPHLDVGAELSRIREKINLGDGALGYWDVLKDASLRSNFAILACLVVFQQFSGAPATIVYSQIIFSESRCPAPEFCALGYSLVFFLANAFGIYLVPKYSKRRVLLFSSIGVSLLLLVQIVVLVQKLNEFASLVVLLLFNLVHSVGLGSVPFSLIADLFPKTAARVLVSFFVMFHSMLALTITKIFQVMLDRLGLFAPFCLFLIISTFCLVFVIIFVPDKPNKANDNT